MNRRKIIGFAMLGVLFAGLLTAWNSFFIVRPDQYAIVTEFGEPKQVVTESGLFIKVPFIQEARYLDARVRGWDDTARDTKTAELRTIDFTAFARWRIAESEVLKYYQAVRTEQRAHAAMDSIVTARIQATVREQRLASIVRDEGRAFDEREELDLRGLISGYDECAPERNKEVAAILSEKRSEKAMHDQAEAKRSEIVAEILMAANETLGAEFGIEILDLHFKYLNYSPQVHQKMIESIKADREKDIAAYRRIGKACEGSIDRTRHSRLGEITGEQEMEVRRIEGEAIARAIEIKAAAFNQNPGFFQFVRTLELYENSLGKRTRLVMSTSNPLLALMNDPTLLERVEQRPGIAAPTARPLPLPLPNAAADGQPEGE